MYPCIVNYIQFLCFSDEKLGDFNEVMKDHCYIRCKNEADKENVDVCEVGSKSTDVCETSKKVKLKFQYVAEIDNLIGNVKSQSQTFL